MDSFLKIRGLKKHFGDNRVLDGIDLDVEAASVTTIIGKSGIGKSVFLKWMAKVFLKVAAVRTVTKASPLATCSRIMHSSIP
jgi:ABC-type transporter Mla maintaining outer membrane lipid asymmetry ATPase subunit MlaF